MNNMKNQKSLEDIAKDSIAEVARGMLANFEWKKITDNVARAVRKRDRRKTRVGGRGEDVAGGKLGYYGNNFRDPSFSVF